MVVRTCRQCGVQFESKSSAGARINYCSRWCQSLGSPYRRRSIREMTVAEAAYLAALLDGEGTVLVIDRRATRPGSSHPSIYVSIAGSYKPMHEWLVRTTGVGYVGPGRVSRMGKKPVYAWRVQAQTAVGVLRQALPYMIEKADRARLAIRCFAEGYGPLDEQRGSPHD